MTLSSTHKHHVTYNIQCTHNTIVVFLTLGGGCLQNNYSKAHLIVLRSSELKCDLRGLSVNVGDSEIMQSSNVRDLSVIFDQFLNVDGHITVIRRGTHFHIKSSVNTRLRINHQLITLLTL